ncbi:hypothetical protein DFP74_0231 [Nocardiopsis sp. Huas11]|uniref:hypothetical protein n=1 Tax=Nocardiopsis sp. Huas11 TaxID=2183912 RepID=UPI000EACF617|nr:hypothetical protein [Nocardiopsis sp. Huas11]RKS04671.1 hypothetical protein DFP74_0231 [Nocardiopsis sp. Huas11]
MRFSPKALAITLAVVALAALWVLVAPYYSTALVWFLRSMATFLVPLAAVIVLTAALRALAERTDGAGLRTAAWVVGIGGLVGCLVWVAFAAPYQRTREYAESIEVVSDAPPEFSERAPYPVAQAQARSNLGAYPGEIGRTGYLSDEELFTTAVVRRGLFAGYEATLQQSVPFQGRGEGEACEFAEAADARVGGMLWANLAREINQERRWVRFSEDDVYSFCDGDTPKVVVPLTRQTGLFAVTLRPAGVAVYDGSTGDLSFAAEADVPGPSYPITLAERQRASSSAMDGFGAWIAGRAGWEPSDEEVTSGNNSEFGLLTTDGPAWVTPMTRRGSATSISAISTVPSRLEDGGLATVTVHELEEAWVSPSAIEQRIQADYRDIPNWQNLVVMEIAPTSGETWSASIGNEQNILYRVQGRGDLMGDEATCLYRADGSEIRCGSLADSDGRGVGTQYGEDGEPLDPAEAPADPAEGPGDPSGDLEELSDEELRGLLDAVAEELGSRLEDD